MSDVLDFQAAQAKRAEAKPPSVELLHAGLGLIDRFISEFGYHTEELAGIADPRCHHLVAHASAIRGIAADIAAGPESA